MIKAIVIGVLSILSLSIWFIRSMSSDNYQEFGITSDYFLLPFIASSFGLTAFYFAKKQSLTFKKAISVNVVAIFFIGLFGVFASMSVIENMNWYFTKETISCKSKIINKKYMEEPIPTSEGDHHIYPYYEITVIVEERKENFDCSPKFIQVLEKQHTDFISIKYRVGILGTKYLLTDIYYY
jgi:hypothetical protein